MDSANKVSVFFESEALDEDGKLKVHPRVSLNKVNYLERKYLIESIFAILKQLSCNHIIIFQVGHALHWLHPIFKKYSFDERVKEVAFQLEYQEPAICQSMYIYKNPGTGSEGI